MERLIDVLKRIGSAICTKLYGAEIEPEQFDRWDDGEKQQQAESSPDQQVAALKAMTGMVGQWRTSATS